MRRKNDEHRDDLEGVAQRLRKERPAASPLELDQIKMAVMSRAKSATRTAPRRLAAAGLTVGLMVAGTGGVIAAGSTGSSVGGNAAEAEYSTTGACDTNNNNNNNNGNGQGNENNNNNNNFNCNNGSFNGNTVNNITTVTNNNTTVTVTDTKTANASSGVQGFTTSKAKTSRRHIKIHIRIGRTSKLRKVTLKVNGKVISVLKGKKASTNINLVNLPCTTGGTTVTIVAVTDSGKVVKESHTYHLCQV